VMEKLSEISANSISSRREDMKHAMIVNLCQKLHFAPIQDPQRILDMGTGTGIWAIESRFTVVGISSCAE